jgi:hypothetical protein
MMAVRYPFDFDAPDDEATGFCTCEHHIGKRKLPRDMFRERPDRPAGIQSWCKACESAERVRRRRRTIFAMRLSMYD